MNFRNELKRQLGHKLLEIKVDSKEEETERTELGIRLMHFLQYEQDPEFEQMFAKFLEKKKLENMGKDINKGKDLFDGRE